MIEGFQLSPQQKHLWHLWQRHPAMPRTVVCSVGLKEGLDLARFSKALDLVCQQHESLRTLFHKIPGLETPVQVVGEDALEWLDPLPLDSVSSAHNQHLAMQRYFQPGSERPRACFGTIDGTPKRLGFAASALMLDDASAIVLFAQAREVYAQLCKGGQPNLEPGPQYIDMSEWLNDLEASPEAEPGRKFWLGQRARLQEHQQNLPGAAPVEDAAFSTWHDTAEVVLNPAQQQSVRLLADACQVQPPSLMFALWQWVLARYLPGEALTTCIAFDGRLDEELKRVVGPLARHVPVCTNQIPSQSLPDYVQAIEASLKDAFSWQECFSWDRYQQQDQHPRPSLGFVFMDQTPLTGTIFQGPLLSSLVDAPFAAQLRVVQAAKGNLSLSIRYQSATLESTRAEQLLSHCLVALETSSCQPHGLMQHIDVFSSAQNQAMTSRCSGIAAELLNQTIPQLLDGQAETRPDAVALAQGNQFLTYACLAKITDLVAADLQPCLPQNGRPETQVAVFLPRRLEALVAMLGIFKAGATYLPLDFNAPPKRIELIAEDADPALVITEPDLAGPLPQKLQARIYTLPLAADKPTAYQSWVDLERAAYLIYTSGTTGKPKGVVVSHQTIANHAADIREAFALNSHSRMLAFASFAFDAVLDQILAPLLAGGTVLLKPDTAWSAEDFDKRIAHYQLTHVNLPTPFWHAWSKARGSDKPLPACLESVIAGGDAMDAAVARQWLASNRKAVTLINAYGPTEACVTALTYRVPTHAITQGSSVAIGKSLPHRHAWILNSASHFCPEWVPGELQLGGSLLARGYYRAARLTAERFVPDPWSQKAGSRVYRTGDRAVSAPLGTISFLGRTDSQVKIRGFRVELGDIEHYLKQYPETQDAVALALSLAENAGDKELIAYVERPGTTDFDEADARNFLKSYLPEYMLPQRMVSLPAFPRLSSGKVDRKSLPAPPKQQTAAVGTNPDAFVAATLRGIWGSLLGRAEFEPAQSFFDLGGHSLNAMQLVSRMRSVFGIQITLQDVFAKPSFSKQVGLIQNKLHQASALARQEVITAVARGGPLPLSFAQHRLWLTCKLDPHNAAYHMPLTLKVKGTFFPEAFESAMTNIILRHENLRANVVLVEDQPFQIIRNPEPWRLVCEEAAGTTPEERERFKDQWLAKIRALPFDLASDLLIRGYWLRMDGETGYLFLVMHHLVSDGWSLGILIREFQAFYQAHQNGHEPHLQPLPIHYADYAAWQHQWFSDSVAQRYLEHWRQYLADVTAPQQLPYDADPETLGPGPHLADSEPFVLPVAATQALHQFGQDQNFTQFMILMAAFQGVLHFLTGSRDLVFGTDIANRNREEEELLIGFFINQTLYRGKVDPDAPLLALIEKVRSDALTNYPFQDFPFDKLVEGLNPPRSASLSPFFQAKLVLQNAPTARMHLPGLELESLPPVVETTKLNLQFNLWEKQQELCGHLKYKQGCFQKPTIQRMLRLFAWFLEAIPAFADQPLSHLLEHLRQCETAHRKEHLTAFKAKGFPGAKSSTLANR